MIIIDTEHGPISENGELLRFNDEAQAKHFVYTEDLDQVYFDIAIRDETLLD